MLNNLLSERDLAGLSCDQRTYLVERIDHALDTDMKVREIIAERLQGSLKEVSSEMQVSYGGREAKR